MREGWVETTLAEIASINPEATAGWDDNHEFRYVDLASVSEENGINQAALASYTIPDAPGRARRVIRESDVLVSTVRPYLRGFAKVPRDLDENVASTGFSVLRSKPEHSIAGFIWAIVRTTEFVDYLMDRATGSNYPAVRPQDIAEFPLRLPPLNEQRRIVDVVESVDSYVAALEKRAEAARTARSALLHDLLSNPGSDWHSFRLRDLAVEKGLIGGPFGSSLVAADYVESGIPVIRGQNMPDSERFVGGEFVFVSEDKAVELKRSQAVPGDLVATQRGTLGQVALVPGDGYPRYVISQSQMRLRVDESRAEASFVYLWLDWDETRATIDSRKSATANPHINLGIFGDLEGVLPPLGKQRAIVDLVAPVDQLILHLVNSIASARNLRSALLADLLSGDHEIPATYDELLVAA